MHVRSVTKTVQHGEETFAYDIHIGTLPVSEHNDRRYYNGDIYVWLGSEDGMGEIAIYDTSCWTSWRPDMVKKVVICGFDAYPAACSKHGFQYLDSAKDCRALLVNPPPTVAMLTRMICEDVGIADPTGDRPSVSSNAMDDEAIPNAFPTSNALGKRRAVERETLVRDSHHTHIPWRYSYAQGCEQGIRGRPSSIACVPIPMEGDSRYAVIGGSWTAI
jgi:hypothetical protein